MSDLRDLGKKISQGDATAFDVFYREQMPRLQAFLRQIVGSREAAEDVAQETFKQLWHGCSGFDPSRGTLRSYLYGMGRKQAAEWWRKHRATEEMADDRSGLGTTESDSTVKDAFARLPEEQRTLLWLREVEGQSYSELAATLGIPVGTVRSRLFAAREALRNIWYRER